jgi:hypothetical protein
MSEPILYVDDNFAMGRTRLEAAGYFVRERAPVGRGLFVREKAPGDVADDDSISFALQDARIVLMDYELHDVNSASTAPLDGLELLERFRARIRRHHAEGASVPLLTIYSHQIHRLAEQLGECPVVPYMLARRANVDWVFDKGEPPAGSDPLADQIGEMLRAFDINMGGSAAGVERQLATFLALPGESDWRELALEELLDLRPPLQKDLSPPGARVRLMKWLLQDALPFPGCFVDLDTVSLRFRVKPMDLAAAIERNPGSQLARRLDGVRYRGPLASFFLPRYWKAGVDFIVWNMTEGRSPANPVVGRSRFAEKTEWLYLGLSVRPVSHGKSRPRWVQDCRSGRQALESARLAHYAPPSLAAASSAHCIWAATIGMAGQQSRRTIKRFTTRLMSNKSDGCVFLVPGLPRNVLCLQRNSRFLHKKIFSLTRSPPSVNSNLPE